MSDSSEIELRNFSRKKSISAFEIPAELANAWERITDDDLRPTYRSEPSGVLMYGPMEPIYACRECPTRHCPVSYDAVCGERPCARFESEDSEPWQMELGSDWVRRMIGR